MDEMKGQGSESNEARKLKAIFYDMDGTLVYFKIDYIKGRQVAIEEMCRHGIPKDRYSTSNPLRLTIEDAKKYYRTVLNKTDDEINEIMSKVNGKIVEIEKAAAENAVPVNGIEKVLKFGRNENLKQVIITFNTNSVAKLTLKKANLSDYIDYIVGRDDVEAPKPDPYHLEYAAKIFNLEPNECVMIGDHQIDIDAARGFGCKSIGIVRDGPLTPVKEADYLIKQSEIPEKLIDILKSML